MRFIYLGLFLVFLLTSCTSEGEIYDEFKTPFSYEVEFSTGEKQIEAKMSFDGKELIVLPKHPEGYKITINASGGKVEYDFIEFDKRVVSSSVFLPYFDMLLSLSKGEAEEIIIEEDPLTLKKDNYILYIKE